MSKEQDKLEIRCELNRIRFDLSQMAQVGHHWEALKVIKECGAIVHAAALDCIRIEVTNGN